MTSGGKRWDGPKAKDGALNTVEKSVLFDAETLEIAVEIGEGNRSLGVRRALRTAGLRLTGKQLNDLENKS